MDRNPVHRSETMALRLRPHEREMVERAAAAEIAKPSEFIREAVLARAREVLRDTEERPPSRNS